MIAPNRLQATDELRDEVEFLTLALSAARVGPWELYSGLGAIYLSDQWGEIFGVDPLPERFTDYLALIDPQDRERVAGEVLRTFLLGEADRWGPFLPASTQLPARRRRPAFRFQTALSIAGSSGRSR